MSDGPANAQRHGVQARPPEAEICRHLERILGHRPMHFELLDPRPDLTAALHLADCEARLDRAHAHYVKMQDVERHKDCDHLQDQLDDMVLFNWITDPFKREAARCIMRLERYSTQHANYEKRLAGRYLREAQSKRDRALVEYMGYV
jgi:hypothetical protein